VNTGFVLVMGEFGWYTEVAPKAFSSTLPSGMPSIVLFIWYVAFMFLILLVLLNMLLAIVIERYDEVVEEQEAEVECPTIWQQIREYIAFRKETKGWRSLESMRRELENDEEPAHKGYEVSAKSLVKAFNVKQEQADWLMNWLKVYIEKKRDKEQKTRGEKMEELAEDNSNKLGLVTEAVLGNKAKIDKLVFEASNAVQTKKDKAPSGGDEAKLATIYQSVEGLMTTIGKVRRDQASLTRRVQDVSGFLPPKPRGGGPRTGAEGSESPTPPDTRDRERDRDRDRDRGADREKRDRDRRDRDRDREPRDRDRDRERGDDRDRERTRRRDDPKE
jgi:hypothetical protein